MPSGLLVHLVGIVSFIVISVMMSVITLENFVNNLLVQGTTVT